MSLLSEQIKIAMDEQKSAISEIAKTVSSINELAQRILQKDWILPNLQST